MWFPIQNPTEEILRPLREENDPTHADSHPSNTASWILDAVEIFCACMKYSYCRKPINFEFLYP